ncbi:MAG: mannose-1-phosphate guanylyltransferase/mannose-6-phosphate isomerase [Alphaproteobacteria bacterium]|nr:mannose-1-phosphate guanylyltransferase/mannose-6-phosphate isomerase [Alphaproteobacteria bacterium]
MVMTMKTIVPVVLCGGSGTRLWPLSRTKTPKQFLRLTDERTLLQKTVLRTLGITGTSCSNFVTVTLGALHEETRRQLEEISPALTEHILGEPEARNTAAATAYAAGYVRNHFGGNAVMWILPADHHIGREDCLGNALEQALAAAHDDHLVTFGIQPTRAETGYGYIMKGEPIDDSGSFRVDNFVEKPPRDMADRFLASGRYLWSSGMHVFKASTIIRNYITHSPDTMVTVEQAMLSGRTDRSPSPEIYRTVREEPFEKAVLEKARKVAVIPCDPQWSDVGSWESLWEIRAKDGNGNATDGKVVCHNTRNSMVLAKERLVMCVGLEDVIIIETGDSILVADKNCNDALKAMIGTLREQGHKETEASNEDHHSWGRSKVIAETGNYSLREVTILPGRSYKNLQAGSSRAGYWIVASGTAHSIIDGLARELGEQESVAVASHSVYSFSNESDEPLRLFEYQYAERDETADIDAMPVEIRKAAIRASLSAN